MLSETEFLQAVQQHQQIIHKVCNMYMDTAADREDLFQEIMISAWKGNRNFKGDAKFSTWLYRVALNTAITFFKKGLRKQAVDQASAAQASETDDARDEEEAQFMAMNRAVSTLNEVDKALVMLYFDNYSYPEIAAILGISANNVAVKMNRIRTRLKEESKKYL